MMEGRGAEEEWMAGGGAGRMQICVLGLKRHGRVT